MPDADPVDADNNADNTRANGEDAAEEVKETRDSPALEALAPLLVWRIGRTTDDGPVTVRVGLASAAALFAELPRLKTVTDAELEVAGREGELRVEWIGHAPEGRGSV